MKQKNTAWEFKVFISSNNKIFSDNAVSNLKDVCKKWLNGNCSIDIIDIVSHPNLLREYQIFAIPTIVRLKPLPVVKLVGNLSDHNKIIAKLELDHYLKPKV